MRNIGTIEIIHTFEAVSFARASSIADATIKTFTKKRIILNDVLLGVLSLTETPGNDKGRRRKTSIKLNYLIVFKDSPEKSCTSYLQFIVLALMTEG